MRVLTILLALLLPAQAQVGGLTPYSRIPVFDVGEQIQFTGFTIVVVPGYLFSSACTYSVLFQTGPNAGIDVAGSGGNDDSVLVPAEIGTCNAPDCGTVLISIVSCS